MRYFLSIIKEYRLLQWEHPKRLFFKGFGISIWKWCGVLFPCWNVYLGSKWHFGYDVFRSGVGISIHFPPVFILDLCLRGRFRLLHKNGIIRIKINNREWFYL